MADRFWVGGTGTWNASSTANWATTSGGAAGASAPTSVDNVFFDANSGTGTCTTASGSASAIITFNSSNLILSLGANHSSTGTFSFTLGQLNLNSFTLTCPFFSSNNANVRVLNFGTGNFTITGNNTVIWNSDNQTNMTVTGNPVVNCTYSGAVGTRSINSGVPGTGGVEANSISFNITAGTDIVTITNSRRYRSINFTGFLGTATNNSLTLYGNLTFSAGMTVNAGTGGTTFAATSGTQQITTNGKTLDFPITQNSPGATLQLQDNLTMGSTRTFTITAGALDLSNGNRTLSTGLFSSSNTNVRSIAFGTGNINITGNAASVWNTENQTNFTYTGSGNVNFTYAGAVGTRNVFCGATNGLISNSINVSVTAGTDTFALQGSRFYKNVNLTGFAGTFVISNYTIYGSLTLSSGITFSGTSTVTFAATSPITITTAGKTFDFPLTFNGVGGTFAFQDALTQGSTRNFTITNGAVQLKNGVTSTVGNFVATNSNVKFLQSTTPGSQATLSQASGTVNVVDLTIQDINAVGGASWNAYTDFENTDAGNNDGWNFSLSPPYSTAELPITLRPFTQPRRF